MKKSRKIVIILSTLLIISCVTGTIYLLINDTTDTYFVSQGVISQEDEAIGYIIRNEKIVKGEDYENGIYAIVAEGQRVAKNEPIFRYYSEEEKEIENKIMELNFQIQEKLENEKSVTSADIKSIEKQIEEKIQNVNNITNYQEIIENKNNIDNLIAKKINFIGEETDSKEIKQLIKERKTYEEQLKKGTQYQKSTISGIVSYRVDGLEEKLTTNNFDEINEKYLNDLDIRTGKIISTSTECGKVIDNFKCYIATTMKSKSAMQTEVGKKVTLRISNNEECKAEIIQINEEDNKRTIIFELSEMPESLINHRKIAIDVIWWTETGLKVPKQALIEENGLYYVIRTKVGVETKVLVKVETQNEKFAIISSYENAELKELGYSSQEIKKYVEISNYDEIVIQK